MAHIGASDTLIQHELRIAKLESDMKELADLQLRSAKAGLMKAIGVKMLADRVTALENKRDGNANKKRKISKDHDSDSDSDGCDMCDVLNGFVSPRDVRVHVPASSVKSKDEDEPKQPQLRVIDVIDAVNKAVNDYNAENPRKKVKIEGIHIEKTNAPQPLP